MPPTEMDKMLAGDLYHAGAPEIQAAQEATRAWMQRFNASAAEGPDTRHRILSERLGAVGEGTVVRPPFHCDYGFNLRLGRGVFINFGCIVLDVVAVEIGDGTQVGPNVQLLAADHPRDAAARATGLEFGRPVRIGRDAWIGDGALVGAGAVVTRDVPAGVTVAGNPARPIASRHD